MKKKAAARRPARPRATAVPASSAPPEKQVAAFIAKFEPSIQRRIRVARAAMRKRFPNVFELVYDNYNFFVIGYGPTERPSEAFASVAANAKNVGIAFLNGAKLPDPKGILRGEGSRNRFIRLGEDADFGDPPVEALLRAASRQGKPLPKTGGIRVVIRSVSVKQRPRRAVRTPTR